jgi:O-antigen/teichoic acid export membrane protein
MPDPKSLLTGGLWVLSGRVAKVASGVLSSIFLARLLSVSDLGRYFLAESVVVAAVTIAQLGLSQTAVRRVATAVGSGDAAGVRRVTTDVVRWGLIGGSVVGLALFGLARALRIEAVLGALAAIWVILQTSEGLLAEILRGFQDIRAATLHVGSVTSTVMCGLLVGAGIAFGSLDPAGAMTLAVISRFTSATMAAWQVHLKLKGYPARAASGERAPVLSESWPIWLNNVAWLVFQQADIWILSLFRPPAEVAVYGIASRLTRLLAEPQLLARSVIAPRIAQLHGQSRPRELEQLVRGSATVAGTLALAAFAVYALFGEPLLGGLYGSVYRTAWPMLLLLAFGQVVSACAGLSATTLMMTGHQRSVMLVSLTTSLVTATASFGMASLFGGVGLAAAVGGGVVLQNVAMLLMARRALGVWTHVQPARWREVRLSW